jgi:hypothetical protein
MRTPFFLFGGEKHEAAAYTPEGGVGQRSAGRGGFRERKRLASVKKESPSEPGADLMAAAAIGVKKEPPICAFCHPDICRTIGPSVPYNHLLDISADNHEKRLAPGTSFMFHYAPGCRFSALSAAQSWNCLESVGTFWIVLDCSGLYAS